MATKGQRLLIRSIKQKNVEQVRLILKSTINVNFLDAAGTSPLCEAVRQRSLPIVRLLVEAEADVNIMDKGQSMPLRLAIDCGQGTVVRYLRTVGASLIPRDGQEVGYPHQKEEILKKQKPVFRLAELPETFAAEKWAGKTKEMIELWQQVPPHLKSRFNFASALVRAKQASLSAKRKPSRDKFKIQKKK